jgi:hypothetical protein
MKKLHKAASTLPPEPCPAIANPPSAIPIMPQLQQPVLFSACLF